MGGAPVRSLCLDVDEGNALAESENTHRTARPPSNKAQAGAARKPRWGLTPIAAEDLLLSVVIPVFNERATVEEVIDRVRDLHDGLGQHHQHPRVVAREPARAPLHTTPPPGGN